MTGPVLRAGAWPAVVGVSGVAAIAISTGGRSLPRWMSSVP